MLPPRLTHINSHSATASGHRTLEELLTALRKVAHCVASFMSVAYRPLPGWLALCPGCRNGSGQCWLSVISFASTL